MTLHATPESGAAAEAPPGPGAPRETAGFHADYAIAALIVLFAAGVWLLTLGFDGVPAAIAGGMAPETFPRLLAGTLVVLALVLAWSARGRADEVRETVPWLVYATAASLVLFMGLVWLIGMVPAMAVAFIGIGRLWGERRWWLLALCGMGLAIAIRVMFVNGFGIPLPGGLIAERLF